MLKDLLNDLEKGDRSKEHLTTKITPPSAQFPLISGQFPLISGQFSFGHGQQVPYSNYGLGYSISS